MGKTRVFNGSGVHFFLKTNMFPDFDIATEHMTVEYVGRFPEWHELLALGYSWEDKFLLTNFGPGDDSKPELFVRVNGYANWKTIEDRYMLVALVEFPELDLDFSYSKNWHITLEAKREPFGYMEIPSIRPETMYSEVVTELWVGYKEKDGTKKTVPFRTLKEASHPSSKHSLSSFLLPPV